MTADFLLEGVSCAGGGGGRGGGEEGGTRRIEHWFFHLQSRAEL